MEDIPGTTKMIKFLANKFLRFLARFRFVLFIVSLFSSNNKTKVLKSKKFSTLSLIVTKIARYSSCNQSLIRRVKISDKNFSFNMDLDIYEFTQSEYFFGLSNN